MGRSHRHADGPCEKLTGTATSSVKPRGWDHLETRLTAGNLEKLGKGGSDDDDDESGSFIDSDLLDDDEERPGYSDGEGEDDEYIRRMKRQMQRFEQGSMASGASSASRAGYRGIVRGRETERSSASRHVGRVRRRAWVHGGCRRGGGRRFIDLTEMGEELLEEDDEGEEEEEEDHYPPAEGRGGVVSDTERLRDRQQQGQHRQRQAQQQVLETYSDAGSTMSEVQATPLKPSTLPLTSSSWRRMTPT